MKSNTAPPTTADTVTTGKSFATFLFSSESDSVN